MTALKSRFCLSAAGHSGSGLFALGQTGRPGHAYDEIRSSTRGALIMKKTTHSGKAPGRGSTTASRAQVRQETRRTQVPRQSQRPGERSKQRRSGKS
jgi:hypothetical protein